MSRTGITIDPPHSTDLDDALEAEAFGEGTKVHVTIAAVAAMAAPGSELDDDARRRLVTRYFAAGHSSMLPRGREAALSLLPGAKRSGITVELTFDPSGAVTDAALALSTIRSRAKVAYGDVPGILSAADHPLHAMMARLMKVASSRLAARRRAGALVLYDLKDGWVASEEGHVKKLERATDAAGHIIVQEMMIAANVAVAEYAQSKGIPVLFRNHQAIGDGPDRIALVALLDEAAKSGESVAWLEEVRRQTSHLVHRAEYGAEALGHFGLNLPSYLHFTSPIRRYADLVTHQQLLAHLLGGPLPYTLEQLSDVAEHINTGLALYRDEERERCKARAKQEIGKALNGRRLDALSDADFERATKVLTQAGAECPEAFAIVYLSRLAEGRVPLLCMALVLLDARVQGERWTELRREVIAVLGRHPEFAVSILDMGKRVVADAPAAEGTVEPIGDVSHPLFRARWTTGAVEAVETASTSRAARQRAGVRLLAQLSGTGIVSFPWSRERGSAPPRAPAPKAHATLAELVAAGKDPLAALGEHAAARAAPPPGYTFTSDGPSHMPTITCTCTYAGSSAVEARGSKADAKRAAAGALIALLP